MCYNEPMKVKLITVGKLKEKYLKDGIAEYIKRLGRFTKFESIELTDEKTPDNASESENKAILDKEGQRILAKVGDRDYVIALAIEGKQFPSEQFAKELEQATLRGYSDITFIIGGSLGLSPKVKKIANQLMSFGLLTFPHQLMRLVRVAELGLAEQPVLAGDIGLDTLLAFERFHRKRRYDRRKTHRVAGGALC